MDDDEHQIHQWREGLHVHHTGLHKGHVEHGGAGEHDLQIGVFLPHFGGDGAGFGDGFRDFGEFRTSGYWKTTLTAVVSMSSATRLR